MKIYKPAPENLVRLQITRQGDDNEYLTLCECTAAEVEKFVKSIIEKENISIFETGKVTSVNIREAVGGKNGKSKSISFKGRSPKQTLGIIINGLEHPF